MFEPLVPPKEKLVDDFHQVIDDAEELLRVTADQASDVVAAVRDRIQNRMQMARINLTELQDTALVQVKAARDATDTFVHQNPWASIGMSAIAGLVVGLIVARRP